METNKALQFPTESIQTRPEAKTASFRTLVVDGDHFMDASMEKALEAQGHLVLTADSAQAALDKTRQFQPDLILLDAGIPGAENLELLSELLVEQASAAVIVVARDASISEAVEAIKMGALDYLERPVDVKKIKKLAENQQAWFKDA